MFPFMKLTEKYSFVLWKCFRTMNTLRNALLPQTATTHFPQQTFPPRGSTYLLMLYVQYGSIANNVRAFLQH